MNTTRIRQVFYILFFFFGLPVASLAQSENSSDVKKVAGKGESNFTGSVSVKMYTEPGNPLNCTMGRVSFQPMARTNWHKHPGGQMLLVTEGIAFYQERGGKKRVLHKGEAVTCSPNVEHWHGASPDGLMTHITVGPNTEKGAVIWLEKVVDEVYLK